jgi:hypothetical protein
MCGQNLQLFSTHEPVPDDSAEQPQQQGSSTNKRAADRFQIFEAAALERLQSGTDATKPAAFLPLPVRLTAIAAAAIAGVGVLWSIVARVPFQVNGVAAFVPHSGMGSLLAPTTGRLLFQVNGLRSNVLPIKQQRNNAVLSRYWETNVSVLTNKVAAVGNLNTLVDAALAPVLGLPLVLPEELGEEEPFDRLGKQLLITYPAGTLLARVINPKAHQDLNGVLLSTLPTVDLQQQQRREHFKRSGQYRNLGGLQQGQRQAIAQELQEHKEMYQRLQGLWKQGFISTAQMLQEKTEVNSLKNKLLEADTSALNTRINSQDQLDQSKQANIANLESRNKLETQLIDYLATSGLFTPEGGFYLLARNARNGTFVRQGDEVLSYTIKPPQLPFQVPMFLDGTAAEQVTEGMSVLLTPKGISRAEFGGIRGRVVEVKKLPLQGEGLQSAIGSRALAASIQRGIPTPYLAWVKLDVADAQYCQQVLSRRCYRWSSGRLPPHPVRLATLADVQITTTYRRPIEFVVPTLSKALGLVVDNK